MTSAERSIMLPAELTSVRQGRLFARDVVREWGCDALADDVQLGVSELITNAVRHAGTDVVLALRLDTELCVEVRDSCPDELEATPPPQDDPFATSGRGLHIVAAVSRKWGITPESGGKTVWFTLALPDTQGADADVFDLDDRRNADAGEAAGEDDDDSAGNGQRTLGMSARGAI